MARFSSLRKIVFLIIAFTLADPRFALGLNPNCLKSQLQDMFYSDGKSHTQVPAKATKSEFTETLMKKGVAKKDAEHFVEVFGNEAHPNSGLAHQILDHVHPERLTNAESRNSIAYTLKNMIEAPDAMKLDPLKVAKMFDTWQPMEIAGMGRYYQVANDALKGVPAGKEVEAVEKALIKDGASAQEAKALTGCGPY